MSGKATTALNRRSFIGAAGATVLTGPALAQQALAQDPSLPSNGTVELEKDIGQAVRRNISSFRSLDWRPYFSNLNNGAILVDISSRALHYWSADGGTYKLYPSSVPLTPDLTKKGRTTIVRKVEGPTWRPTPSMKKRNPEWPPYIGPGPENPLGTRALHLTWTYYRIHGTTQPSSIGRSVSNGCIRMLNAHVKELYNRVPIGTRVVLL